MQMKFGNNKGIAAFWLIMALAVIPTMVYIAGNYANITKRIQRLTQSTTSKQQIYVIKNMLMQQVKDVDSDGSMELLVEDAGNAVPASLSVRATDEWGTDFFYCAWDLGALNGSDANYTVNNAGAVYAAPASSPIGRIISAGRNRVVDTACADDASGGDDIVVDIFESDALASTSGISGWADDGSYVRLITPTDSVGIGVDTPAEQLEVAGAIKLGTTAGTNAGTIRWNGSNFQGYNGSAWKNFDTSSAPAVTFTSGSTYTNGAANVARYTQNTVFQEIKVCRVAKNASGTLKFLTQVVSDNGTEIQFRIMKNNVSQHGPYAMSSTTASSYNLDVTVTGNDLVQLQMASSDGVAKAVNTMFSARSNNDDGAGAVVCYESYGATYAP